MFTLKLYDRKGKELNLGDIVKVSDGRAFQFFARVTWLESEQAIAPFHTFSFSSFEKVNSLPEGAVKSREERYDIWYVPQELAEADTEADQFERYLLDWRACEHHLEKRCWRIAPEKPNCYSVA